MWYFKTLNKIEILFSGSNHKVSNNDYYNSQYTVSQYLTEFLEIITRKISLFFCTKYLVSNIREMIAYFTTILSIFTHVIIWIRINLFFRHTSRSRLKVGGQSRRLSVLSVNYYADVHSSNPQANRQGIDALLHNL